MTLLVLIQILGQIGPVHAEQNSWEQIDQEIRNLWRVRSKVIMVPGQKGEKQLDQILILQQKYNIQNLSILTELLLDELGAMPISESLLDVRYRMAVELSKDSPLPEYHLCRFSSNFDEWKIMLGACYKGLIKEWSNPFSRLNLFVCFAQCCFYASCFSLLIVLILFLTKYGDFIVQYYSSSFKALTPINFLLILVMVFGLIYMVMGPAGVILAFTPFLWRFTKVDEKHLLTVSTIGFSIFVSMLFFPLAMEKQARENLGIVFNEIHSGFRIAQNMENLKQALSENPEDPEALFALGTLEKSIHQNEEAEIHLNKATRLAPAWPKPWINLANLNFPEEDISITRENYEKLLDRFPNNFLIHANASILSSRVGDIEKRQMHEDKMRKIDGRKYNQIKTRLTQHEILIDSNIEPSDYAQRVITINPQTLQSFQSIFRHYFTFFSFTSYCICLCLTMLICIMFRKFISLQPLFLVYREKLSMIRETNSKTLVQQRRGLLPEIHNPWKRFFLSVMPGVYLFLTGELSKSFWNLFSILFSVVACVISYKYCWEGYHFPFFIIFLFLLTLTYASHIANLRYKKRKPS
ncbi:MAG: hypothetical protein R3A11_09590 [Bdellovibrionota bacterium]